MRPMQIAFSQTKHNQRLAGVLGEPTKCSLSIFILITAVFAGLTVKRVTHSYGNRNEWRQNSYDHPNREVGQCELFHVCKEPLTWPREFTHLYWMAIIRWLTHWL